MIKRSLFIIALGVVLLPPVAGSAEDLSYGFRNGVSRQVKRQTLQRDYPVKQSSRVSKMRTNADGIRGVDPRYRIYKMGEKVPPNEKIYQRSTIRGRSVQ